MKNDITVLPPDLRNIFFSVLIEVLPDNTESPLIHCFTELFIFL